MIKIIIDQDKCIGCGTCGSTHPDNFEILDFKAIVLNDEVEDDSVIRGCCTEAIRRAE